MSTDTSSTEKMTQEDSAAYDAQRREKRRKLVSRIILVLCILGGVGLGLLLRQAGPKQSAEKSFDADGLLLTISSRFQETGDRNGFDRAYFSNHEQIYVSNEAAADEALTDYAVRRVAQLATGAAATALTENGLTGFEYRITEENKSYACLACFYEGEGRVWTVLFRCAAGDYEKYRPDFLQFAASALLESARPEA